MANVKSRDPEVVASNISALLRRYEATYGSDPANTTLSTQVSKTSVVIRPLLTGELQPAELDAFLAVGFTNHYEILAHSKGADERLFYILHMSSCHTRTHPSASFSARTKTSELWNLLFVTCINLWVWQPITQASICRPNIKAFCLNLTI